MITIWLFSEFAQSSLYNTQNLYFCLSDWRVESFIQIYSEEMPATISTV